MKAIAYETYGAPEDLRALAGMVDQGTLRPVVARRFRRDEGGEAFRLLGEGHPGGKFVLVPPGSATLAGAPGQS